MAPLRWRRNPAAPAPLLLTSAAAAAAIAAAVVSFRAAAAVAFSWQQRAPQPRAPKVWRQTRGGETPSSSPRDLEAMKARMEELRVRVERTKRAKVRDSEARKAVASGRPVAPAPWCLTEHPSSPGVWYYHNEETGETTWTPPVWQKVPHPSEPGRFYYHNPYTGETTWDEPACYQHTALEVEDEGGGEVAAPALSFAETDQDDYLRKAALVAMVAAVPVGSWWLTGKWWKLPLLLALPLMLYRMWTTRGDADKMAEASVSCDRRYVAASEAQRRELHTFMCSGCGYTLFPARGREATFFADGFRCPVCAAPKEDFLDARAASEESPPPAAEEVLAVRP